MQNNTIHTLEFNVQKYGSTAARESLTSNVFLDNVAFVDVFEFGASISDSVFEEEVFDADVFYQDY